LYTFIKKVNNRGSLSVALVLGLIVILLFSACKDSGSVGGAIEGPGSNLSIDTMLVTDTESESLASYTGNLGLFSAGRFEDPLFGDVEAMGLIKPALTSSNEDVQFADSTAMRLKLAINRPTVYGDTLSQAEFNLVEINELWRASAWRLNDEIDLSAGAPVASFTLADEDTIEIPLSNEWAQKYGEFYNSSDSTRDSSYVRELFGLAVVPQNASKIVSVNSVDSRFIITGLDNSSDAAEPDSLEVGLRESAYSVDRLEVSAGIAGEDKVYNTLEQVLTLDFDFSSETIQPVNISRVELVIPRDNLLMQESIEQAGPSAVRPPAGTLRMHLVEGDELPQSIDPGAPIVQPATFDGSDNAYHFNMTGLVRQRFFDNIDPDLTFYLTVGGDNIGVATTNDGVIRSTVLYNDEADANAPKVIVTSTNNQ
jgi:hypothetical protein